MSFARVKGLLAVVVTAVAVNSSVIGTAHAYIDPGTGTMVLQMVGAMIAAGIFYLRGARIWISRHFGFSKSDVAPPSAKDDNETKPQ